MHILFLSHYFPPEVNAPATRTHEHCRRWVDAGHRVTVITCAPNCPSGILFDGYRNKWRQEETIDGIRVLRVWTYLSANKGFFKRIVNYVSYLFSATLCATAVRDVDVIVATSPQFFCGWAGVVCSWLLRRPFVLEVRDIWPESIVALGAIRSRAARRLLEWLERRMYAAAGRIVTVGDGYRERLLARGVSPDTIAVIPNGVDGSQFAPFPSSPAAGLSRPNDGKFVCAYIGTVGMAHGLEVVLRAAQKLERAGRADVEFWIVGDGAERLPLQHEAESVRLKNVFFTGLVPKACMPGLIGACDACLVHLKKTDLFETVIPSKIFEIMAMNVPIIMGVRGRAQAIVQAADAGLPMIPEDEDSLIAAIDSIRSNPDTFSGGRPYVTAHFDRNLLAQQMLEELTVLVGGKPQVDETVSEEPALAEVPGFQFVEQRAKQAA